MSYCIGSTGEQGERRPLVYKLHLCVGANILNGLRQERRLMSLLTHLLLDEFVRLVNTLL
jgi:hypothetical protein